MKKKTGAGRDSLGFAGFYASYLNLRIDLVDLGLEPFHRRLTLRQRIGLSLAFAAVAAVMALFLDAWAGLMFLTLALYVTWNHGHTITHREKQVLWTSLDVILFFALVGRVAALYQAAGLLLLALSLHVAWIWTRKPQPKQDRGRRP